MESDAEPAKNVRFEDFNGIAPPEDVAWNKMTRADFMKILSEEIAKREKQLKSDADEDEKKKYDKDRVNRLLASKLYVGLTVPGFPKMTSSILLSLKYRFNE